MAAQSNELVKSYTTKEKAILLASLGLVAVGLLTSYLVISGAGLFIYGVSELRRRNRVAEETVNAVASLLSSLSKPHSN